MLFIHTVRGLILPEMLRKVDYDEIELETVHANIASHAKRGYCGHLQYQMQTSAGTPTQAPGTYIHMARSESDVDRNGNPPISEEKIQAMLERKKDAIDAWIERPSRFLLIGLMYGIINTVLISDASHLKQI